MPKFEVLSREIAEQIQKARQGAALSPMAFDDGKVQRRIDTAKDIATVWRPTFVHDIDKILHCPFYNRYTDKTQVFSLYKNDDITRRSLHVQLVSRIARTIGAALGLNLDLIEAISLGHDLGDLSLSALQQAHWTLFLPQSAIGARVRQHLSSQHQPANAQRHCHAQR